MFRRILVPVDLDDPGSAQGSMSLAKQLSDVCGATLTVVSLVPEGRRQDWQSKLDRFIEAERSAYVPGIEGELGTAETVGGGIVEAARRHGADLIVMTSHDPTAPGAEMGSNAAHVLTHTPCSVLSVR